MALKYFWVLLAVLNCLLSSIFWITNTVIKSNGLIIRKLDKGGLYEDKISFIF